jgi:uncharacterized membrane protein
MALSRRLAAWVREGLIDADTAQRIEAYEATHRRPTALYALVGLGALAIGMGLIAIVGANWDEIPAYLKLVSGLVAIGRDGHPTITDLRGHR